MLKIEKPGEDEYAPYTIRYIGLLPDDGPRILSRQRHQGTLSVTPVGVVRL
jgi:hypothetical protein